MFSEPAWRSSKNVTIVPVPLLHSFDSVKFIGNTACSFFPSLTFFSTLYSSRLPCHQFTPWNTCHNPFRLNRSNKVLEKDVFLFHIKLQMSFLQNHQPWIAEYCWIWIFPLQSFRFSSRKPNFIMPWRVIQDHTSKLPTITPSLASWT